MRPEKRVPVALLASRQRRQQCDWPEIHVAVSVGACDADRRKRYRPLALYGYKWLGLAGEAASAVRDAFKKDRWGPRAIQR